MGVGAYTAVKQILGNNYDCMLTRRSGRNRPQHLNFEIFQGFHWHLLCTYYILYIIDGKFFICLNLKVQ